MPMTENGFRKQTYAEILEQQCTRAKDLFGGDIDTSEKSVLGKYIRLNVSDFAKQEEALEQIYLARYIDTATGISLDRLAPFAGIQRNNAVSAVIRVKFVNSGSEPVVIPMNTKVINTYGVLYHTTSAITVNAGDAEHNFSAVRLECDTAGTIGNLVSEMRFYQTQIANVQIKRLSGIELLYPEIYRYGEEIETDSDLRARWKKAILGSGSGTANSIVGAVAKIDTVQDCIIYENDTDEKVNHIAPHSFTLVAKGGEGKSAEIAAAIFEKKPLGIQAYVENPLDGVEEIVTDIAGVDHKICFYYASPVKVKVKITVSQEVEPDFKPDEVMDEFTKAIVDYFDTLKIGETIYARKLYLPLIQTGKVCCIENIGLYRPIGGKEIYVSEIGTALSGYAALYDDGVEIEVI